MESVESDGCEVRLPMPFPPIRTWIVRQEVQTSATRRRGKVGSSKLNYLKYCIKSAIGLIDVIVSKGKNVPTRGGALGSGVVF